MITRDSDVFKLNTGNKILTLLGVPDICRPLYRAPVPSEYVNAFVNVPVCENLMRGRMHDIDVLIGIDYYYDILTPQTVLGTNGL